MNDTPTLIESVSTAPPSARVAFWTRAGALVILLSNAQLWINRHLGQLDFNWLGIGGVLTVLLGALKILDRYLAEPEKDELKRAGRGANSIVRRTLLSWSFLSFAGVASLLIMLTWSSILVVDDDGNPIGGASASRLAGASAPWIIRSHGRTVVPVTPFGRPYRVEVPGYLPRVVVTPPLTGIVLQASRDLRRTETAIIRLPSKTLPMIENGHRIRVWRGSALLLDVTTKAGSVMIGPRAGINAERMAFWELELSAQSVVNPVASNARLLWYRPEWVGDGVHLFPGDTLYASACLAVKEDGRTNWQLVAEGTWTMLDDEATDVQLDWVEDKECQP